MGLSVRLARPVGFWIQPTKHSNINSRLSYDLPPGPDSPPELSLDEILEVLDEMFQERVIGVFVEGGEPLLRDDLFEILEFATPNAFVILRTNGTLVTSEVARRLKAAKVGVVSVDLFGATSRTHDYLTGTAGSFERSIDGIHRLVAAGVPTYLTTILNRVNASEIQPLLDLTHELRAQKLGVLRLYPLGRARENWDELALGLDAQMEVLDSLRPPGDVQLMQSWHPNNPNCCWQTSAVDAYGNSIGCPYLRDFVNYGNVRGGSFMSTWRHPLYEKIRSAQVGGSCGDCASNDGTTSGGCRSTAYAFTGRWDAPDPYCSVMNGGNDLTKLPDRIRNGPFGPLPVLGDLLQSSSGEGSQRREEGANATLP